MVNDALVNDSAVNDSADSGAGPLQVLGKVALQVPGPAHVGARWQLSSMRVLQVAAPARVSGPPVSILIAGIALARGGLAVLMPSQPAPHMALQMSGASGALSVGTPAVLQAALSLTVQPGASALRLGTVGLHVKVQAIGARPLSVGEGRFAVRLAVAGAAPLLLGQPMPLGRIVGAPALRLGRSSGPGLVRAGPLMLRPMSAADLVLLGGLRGPAGARVRLRQAFPLALGPVTLLQEGVC